LPIFSTYERATGAASITFDKPELFCILSPFFIYLSFQRAEQS
jgi:hypothetical protein